ncbi:hypothetical protein TNCV_1628431 [Trichonephila clavipes]|nr:hypothetical protein TNCV_1628431 [Trichonephila clavipes]
MALNSRQTFPKLAVGLAPAEIVFLVDFQAAISTISNNTLTDCLLTIPSRTQIAEAPGERRGRCPLSTNHRTCIWEYTSTGSAWVLTRLVRFAANAKENGNHLLQYIGLYEYPTDDVVYRYWETRRQMVKKPRTGVE